MEISNPQIFFYNPTGNDKQQGNAPRQQNYWAPHPMPVAPAAPAISYPPQVQQPASTLVCPPALRMTPVASPQPTYLQQPAVLGHDNTTGTMLQIECGNLNFRAASRGDTATPPLSRCSSINNTPSPQSATLEWLPMTPVNYSFDFNGINGVKPGCEQDVFEEVLASTEFHNAEMNDLMLSPPLTPATVDAVAQHPPAKREGSYLLTTDACPALSPSPATSFVETPFRNGTLPEYCNPRLLTKDSTASPSPCLPVLPITDDDDERIVVSSEIERPLTNSSEPTFSQPTFLDTLDELPQTLPQTDNANYLGSKRQRVDNLESLPEPFVFDDSETDFFRFDGPTLSLSAEAMSREQSTQSFSTEVDAEHGEEQTQNASENPQSADANQQSATATSDANTAATPANSATPVMPPAPSRRGRKQSMSEDPSKQYACTQCSRRFRRQEHLKRHVRSLHTDEKPFTCNDCGKKFSRSDNLAQHQRTHGTNSVTMEVMENHVDHQFHSDGYETYDPAQLGNTLYVAATNVSSSSSSDSSDFEQSDGRKRKREE